MDDNEVPANQGITRDDKGRFVPGVSGNPSGGDGRPKFSIKELVRKHLEDNPADLKEFVQHFIIKNRELAWQMMEGKPPQDTTIIGGELPFIIKIIKDGGTEGEDG